MMTMSQVVHGTAPAATGDGRESRGGRHTVPGAEQQVLDQAPNTGGTLDLQRHREESASSVGDVSRESAHGELLAHHANPINISRWRPQREARVADDDHVPSSARDSACCDGRRGRVTGRQAHRSRRRTTSA